VVVVRSAQCVIFFYYFHRASKPNPTTARMTAMAFVGSHCKLQTRFLTVPSSPWNRNFLSCLGHTNGPQLFRNPLAAAEAGRRVLVNSSLSSPPPSSSSYSFADRTCRSNHRHFSSSPNASSLKMQPSYQVYGETCALTIKVVLPSFRVLGSSTVVLEAKSRGRLLLEWTPRRNDGTLDHCQ
jgi:hypothetical protein